MAVSRNTKRGARAVLAMSVLAMAAAVMPAHAANEPILLNSSMDNGWSIGVVAARYDLPLQASSSITLEKADGTPVAGTSSLTWSAYPDRKDALAWAPPAGQDRLLPQGTYEATLTATSDVRDENGLQVGGTLTSVLAFKVDRVAPVMPVLRSPTQLTLGQTVFGPDETVTIAGSVRDNIAQSDPIGSFRSGITAVDIEIYKPGLDPRAPQMVGGAPTRPALTACADQRCEKEFSFSPELGTGYYTVKVFGVDVAGNRSPAAVISFLKA